MNCLKSLSLTLIFLWLPCLASADNHYLISLDPHWEVKPILTVGEKAANGYVMTGIPDGLGAYDNGDGSFTVLMNHEIPSSKGVVRAHGSKGAFVSSWIIQLADLKVLQGEDLIHQVQLWNPATASYQASQNAVFGRFCSADLAPVSAFYDAPSGKGYQERLLLNGEEEKELGGRAFAHVATGALKGTSFELPYLGRVAWENLLALPDAGSRTVVVGMDDFVGGHVYVYVGEKRSKGNPAELAGLVGGKLYTVKFEHARFLLLPLDNVVGLNGKVLRAKADALGATPLLRPEDGAWDKLNHNRFWFATTDKIDGLSQIFQLDFDDVQQPEKGGKLSTALTAKDIGGQMFDNIATDGSGRLLIDEDPGEDKFTSGIWLYEPQQSHKARRIFEGSAQYFREEQDPHFMGFDEEQSGILEVTDIVSGAPWFDAARRYYLGVMQIHQTPNDPVLAETLVEYGQLYLLSGPKN
ncbi:MAG: alkaline phosphatase PhoX [Methylophilaceae bacterium]